MKRYSPSETCPLCGWLRHTVTMSFRAQPSFGSCKEDSNHLHRVCESCGGAVCRAPLTNEPIAYATMRDDVPIRGILRRPKAKRRASRPRSTP